jgi:uncharacterized protein (DUF58 family)
VRIPNTSIRTTSKANWLIEFSIAFLVLGILTREAIFVAVGAGVSLTLAYLGHAFHQELAVLRRSIRISQHLSKTKIFLGDRVESVLKIENSSKLTAHLTALQPEVEESLRFEFSSSARRRLLAGAEVSFDFTVMPSARGHYEIATYRLTMADARDLFAGELSTPTTEARRIEVYPGAGIVAPLTPLTLYGGRPETRRKASSGTDYAGTRRYVLGDSYHRIEWKATARLRTLMVKEFHPETEMILRILIDAGKTMRRQSYVGTKLDEAFALAEMLTETTVTPQTPVGVWVFDETKIVNTMRPALAVEQVRRIRESSLLLQAEKVAGTQLVPLSGPRALPRSRSTMPMGGRVLSFLQLLRLKLGLAQQQTGAYKAFTEATRTGERGLVFVLTDLETTTEPLLAAVSSHQGRGTKTMVAQIGAAWRLNDDLEQAYAEHQRNDRILRRLERFGLTVFDLRPEALLEAVARQIDKTLSAVSIHQ